MHLAENSEEYHFNAKKDVTQMIYRVTTMQNYKSIFGYVSTASQFLKIEVAYPRLVTTLHNILVGMPGKKLPGISLQIDDLRGIELVETAATETFNSNLDAVLQFMVDAGLRGCQWCRSRGENVPWDQRRSTCAYEMRARIQDLHIMDDDDSIAPLRIVSFDIEAAGRRGVFPQPEIDPVIQIALHFHVLPMADGLVNENPRPILLSLRQCDPIDGVDVLCFEEEAKLLCAFRAIVVAFDTDVFSGYNVCGFDFGYLQKRAATLEVGAEFDAMTRTQQSKLTIRETEFFSAQMGKQRRVKVTIMGRAVLDMLMAIRNNQSYRLEKYTLDAVSAYFLGDHKKDVHFTQITPMWNKDSASRRELGEYCLHDAKLPIDLMQKLDSLTQTIEMARAVGVSFDYVMQRGQMIRNASLLLRSAKIRCFVFPNKTPFSRQKTQPKDVAPGRNIRYQGATVLDPRCGVHRYVGVVDFSAMYPSIMRAHNICASSIILHGDRGGIEEGDLLRICGHVFVSEKHVKGLIPEVVELLQNCRTKAKKAYAEATDPLQKKVCKARELAYKVAGNGVYGALGSALSLVPLMAIAESVTAMGRNDIMLVKKTAETMFPDAVVVYGDTDSVFVRHHIADLGTREAVEEASRLTIALADAVNEKMKYPKKLEFEKVYGGLLYSPNHKWGEEPPIDIKGLQSQRRDGCPLVRDLVRDCLTSILHTGSETEATALVRGRLTELMDDTVPMEAYAIQKTLRKTMQDVCYPMTAAEIASIRKKLPQPGKGDQLSYAEQDEAIRLKIDLPWRIRVRLPHVLLAYRMRKKDAGSAPVSGDIIRYIVTNNGQNDKVWAKAESLEVAFHHTAACFIMLHHTAACFIMFHHTAACFITLQPASSCFITLQPASSCFIMFHHTTFNALWRQDVIAKSIVVDRKYYLKSLHTPLINMFMPIVAQKFENSGEMNADPKWFTKKAETDTERLLFDITKQRPWRFNAALKKASIDKSPLALAFSKCKKRAADEESCGSDAKKKK
jgi:DNA polymerase delta subunit 1